MVSTSGWRATATLENAGSGTFPVEVACEGGTGNVTVIVAAGERREFALRCDAEPTALIVDPHNEVLQNERAAARARF